MGELRYDIQSEICEDTQEEGYYLSSFRYVRDDGTVHPFDVNYYEPADFCNYTPMPTEGLATDGSGFYLDALTGRVWAPSGTIATEYKNTNGNFVSAGWDGTGSTITDTAGRVIFRKIVSSQTLTQFQYKDASGNWQTVKLNKQLRNIKTNFQCTQPWQEWSGSAYLPVSIELANGQMYTFTYEDTPGYPGYTTARLKRVTLPTGGYYEYTYPTTGNKGINCEDATAVSLTRIINDVTTSQTWQYARTKTQTSPLTWKTLVTPPVLPYDSSANQSVYVFTVVNWLAEEQTEKHYQGSEATGQLLRTVKTVLNRPDYVILRPTSITTTLENNQQSKIETDIDGYGNLLEKREYEWGSGTPGALLRKTTISYLNSAPYTARHIHNRSTQILVRDGAGNLTSRTDIAYDGASLVDCPSGVSNHDSTNYGLSLAYRGNPTSVKRFINPAAGTGDLTQSMSYDCLGNLRSVTDPGGHTTNFSYADNYSDGMNRNSYAYLTQTTKPAPFNGQTIQQKYFYHTGQTQAITDENSRSTTFQFTDVFNRPTQTDFPDGGRISITYNDTARTVTTTQKRTSTENIVVTEVFDPLGRPSQTQQPGSRKVDTVYDAHGGAWKVSNPYVSTGDATYGVLETRVDALGRVRHVINQDASSTQTEYHGNAIRFTDESGKQRITQSDALGRITRVCEVTAGNGRSPAQSCGMTGFGGTGYLTTMSYSVVSGFVQTQTTQGSQARVEKFDGLGRVTSAGIPEVGATAVSYAYDSDGSRTSVTDPRGTVSFEYDQLHRTTKKKHGSTVVASYSYDGTQANNAIGRLITERDGDTGSNADKTDYTYDSVGRVLTANRTISSTPYAMGYAYDLMGNLTSINYPSSSGTRRKVDYVYNVNAELNIVRDTTGTAFDYVTAATYSNLGPLQQFDLGNGVRTTLGWNKRGFSTSLLTQKVGGASYLQLTYSHHANGQAQQIVNNLVSNQTQDEKYAYDELQRLLTAQRGPDSNIQRKYAYDYDRYGNRWAQIVVAGSGLGRTDSYNSGNNRVTSANFSYDNSGNATATGSGTSFGFNAENFLTSSSTTLGSGTYVRDARGRRVRKTAGSTVTEYFYSGSELIAEKTGSVWTDYMYFGGVRVAQVVKDGANPAVITYLHTDHLGSTRVCTDANGSSVGTCNFEPFGEVQPGSTCSVPTGFRFAGMQWDNETGLYHTWFRAYDPNQARWLGVDALPGAAASGPQSLNRYGYAFNDSVNLADPFGLSPCPPGCTAITETIRGEVNGDPTTITRVTGCDCGGGKWVPAFGPCFEVVSRIL